MVRNQAEKILRDLDIVKREEFEAVKGLWPAWRCEKTGVEGPHRGAGDQARHVGNGAGYRWHEDGRVGAAAFSFMPG